MLKKIQKKLSSFFTLECSCKLWIGTVLSITFAIIGGVALLVYIVDPFYRYRMPSGTTQSTMRCMPPLRRF